MKNHRTRWIAMASICCFLPVSAFAQEGPPAANSSPQDLENLSLEDLFNVVVVTASAGVKESSTMAPANVQSISADEIALHGWRSLSEVLSNVLGLYVIGDLVQPSVGVRGVTGGYGAGTRILKIMIDGTEVTFRPSLSAAIGPEYISMEAVDHIEVAKGPLSALYGANAFLATVNVITRDASRGLSASAALRGVVQQEALGGGLSGMVSYSNQRHSALVAVSADRIDRSGLSIRPTFSQNPSLPRYSVLFGRESSNDLARPIGVFAKYSYTAPSLGTLFTEGGLQQSDAYGEFQPNSVFTGRSRYQLRNYWWAGRFDHAWNSAIDSSLHAGLSSGAPTNNEQLFLTGANDSYYTRRFSYLAGDAALSLNARLGKRVMITAGGDFNCEHDHVLYFGQTYLAKVGAIQAGITLDQTQPGDRTQVDLRNLGARVQLTANPLSDPERLKLSGNFRLDFPNLFPTQYSWRAAAAYRWTSSLVSKLIVGRAFQAPSAVLMFAIPGFGAAANIVGSQRMSNVAPLVPQTIQSAELVTSYGLGKRAAIELAIFVQQVDSEIEFVQLSGNFVPVNRGQQRGIGLEASFRSHLGIASPYLQGALSWTTLEDPASPAQGHLSLTPPALYPAVSGTGGMNLDLSKYFLRGNAQVRVVGARSASQSNILLNSNSRYELAPYAMIDAALSSAGLYLLGAKREARFTLSLRNLLGTLVSDPGFVGFDIPLPGRTVLLEIRQSL